MERVEAVEAVSPEAAGVSDALSPTRSAPAPAGRRQVLSPRGGAGGPRGAGGRSGEIQLFISGPSSPDCPSPIKALLTDRIADVKFKVQARKGWFTSHQRLIFGDQELADDEQVGTVAELAARAWSEEGSPERAGGGGDGAAAVGGDGSPQNIHLVVRLSDIVSVRIKTLQGETLLSVSAEDTVRDLKAALALESGMAPDAQNLLLDGQVLSDGSLPVGDLGLTPDSVVHLLIKRSAKVKVKPLQSEGSVFELSINASETVDMVKHRICAREGVISQAHALCFEGRELPPGSLISRSGVPLGEGELELVPIQPRKPVGPKDLSVSLENLVNVFKKAQAGLDLGFAPTLASAGTGGAYFLLGPDGSRVGVFKPQDEEPGAWNNPRGIHTLGDGGGASWSGGEAEGTDVQEGLRKGSVVGEGAYREFAAYILDYGGLSGVPPTAICSARITECGKFARMGVAGEGKCGSLQMFVRSDSDCEERGVSEFPASEVHKIALLDMRLGNCDRNGSNVLARKVGGEWKLTPIDHGYCLPAALDDISFEWVHWPQSRQVFSADLRDFVAALDADADLEMLRSHGVELRRECVRVFRVCTMLLRKGVAAGLTARQLGEIYCRQTTSKSILEKLSNRALRLAAAEAGIKVFKSAMSDFKEIGEDSYLRHMADLLDEFMQDLSGSFSEE